MFFPKGRIWNTHFIRYCQQCSLVRKEVFGTIAHLANYQNGPAPSLLEWQWGWSGWDFHSHTDHSQNPCHLQSQKLRADTGSIFPKTYCARKVQNTQNAPLNSSWSVNSMVFSGIIDTVAIARPKRTTKAMREVRKGHRPLEISYEHSKVFLSQMPL